MKVKNNKKMYSFLLFLLSLFLFSSRVNAYCTPDSWYTCEGSYSVHYVISTNCQTSSNSIYCQYGCSGGNCQSAPTTTTTIYTPPTTIYTPPYQTCTPWTTTNRYCACSTQVAYSRCNMWGTGWDSIVENCPSGTSCSNGQCISRCSIGYTGNYQCSGNWRQQEYKNPDCTSSWINSDYCSSGCSNGQCVSCTAQYLNNYQCSGNWQQRQYQNPDCSLTWNNYQYCSNGCSNGQCISAPVCTPQYLDNYQCSGNWRQRQYQNSDCSVSWQNFERCPNGCSNGQCVSCDAKYLDEWQCSGNWRQRKYQDSDCSFVWQNYEYCSNGCSSGSCQTCSAHYTGNYQCSGSWRQQEYINDDCSSTWTNAEYCSYGCSGGSCMPSCQTYYGHRYYGYQYYSSCQTGCSISAYVTTPDDTYLGNIVSTTVTFTNNGDSGGYVNFNSYICKNDYDGCAYMICEDGSYGVYGNDPRVYIGGHDSRSFTCTVTAREPSDHRIKVEYYGCDNTYADPAVYSGTFKVFDRYYTGGYYSGCTQQYLSNYDCFGNWRRQQYQSYDCSMTMKNIEYCGNGCSAGSCTSTSYTTTTTVPTGGSPLVSVKEDYTVNKCEINSFSFDVMNVGPSQATFDIKSSGSAADWIRTDSTITLDKNEKRSVTGYASVPCDAKGQYDFTITVSGATSSSATSYLKVNEPAGGFTGWAIAFPTVPIEWIIILLVILLLIVLLLIIWLLLRRRNGYGRRLFRRGCGAESF